MTGSSILVPVVGVLIAPLLARGLGVSGRGELAVALAPQSLLVAVAALGLNDALTYHLAQKHDDLGALLLSSTLASAILGLLLLSIAWVASGYLSGGDSELAGFILIGAAAGIPQSFISLLRGAAAGLQQWGAIALERVLSSVLRLAILIVLLSTNLLDVRAAVIAMSLVPIAAGVPYWRVIRAAIESRQTASLLARVRSLYRYGFSTWLGSVASMLSGRTAQLFTAPLAGTSQLGLLVVAITIADVLFVLFASVKDALFGHNSRSDDRENLQRTARVTFVLAVGIAISVGGTLPLWIGVVFGDGFKSSIYPAWFLLAAAAINVPGQLAGSGLASWNRPGLRSLASIISLLVLLGAFFALVPPYGAIGAGIAALISGATFSSFTVLAATRIGGGSPWSYLAPRWSDAKILLSAFRLRRPQSIG